MKGKFLYLFVVLAIIILFSFWWCFRPNDVSSPKRWTVDESSDSQKKMFGSDSRFLFVSAIGSGRFGFNVLRISSDGEVEYTYKESSKWRRGKGNISPNIVIELRKLLLAESFVTLSREYHAEVADGTQWYFKIEGDGFEKSVYCNNNFPEPLQRIATFCETHIIDKVPTLKSGSVEMDIAEVRKIRIP